MNQTIAKIRSFQSLPRGWYYGEGDAIGYDAREKAIHFVLEAEKNGIEKSDAFPGPDGQLGLSLYVGKRTLAISIETDRTFNVIEDIENRVIDESYEINEAEARLKLWEFSQGTRISSASSTFNIGSPREIGSLIMLLNALHRETDNPAECHSSVQNVSIIPTSPFANTYDTFTL